jgi:wyosine [tRNA(Phe)-imidazoG37] synthetase (radical SAM superfamily)
MRKMKQRVPYWVGIIYGPVSSRRLGSSLGINLFPSRKVCNFDCIYCHFGKTGEGGSRPEKLPLPSADEVGRALATYLLSSTQPEVITFAGNGEPTLHPRFAEIVTKVVGVRDRLAPEVPLAILSNSTRVHDLRVRTALLALDLRVMKLDAAEQETFMQMHRPYQRIQVKEIVAGLCRLRPLTVQSLFVEGEVENCSEVKVERLIAALKQIQPYEVEVYTAVRWTAELFVKAVDGRRLEKIAAMINAAGIRARVY